MEVVATAKWVRTTARKARLVSAMVTGLPVAEALVVLNFSPRSAAADIAKVIKSAAANAEHNYNLDASSLRVARVEVDGAMIIKRWRAKPRGMAGSIFKRTSHLRAFVTDDEMPANVRRRSAVKLPRTVVPTPIVSAPAGAAATGSAASGSAPATPASGAAAPAATPKPARRRTPKPPAEAE